MFLYLYFIYCTNMFRISMFYDPSVKLLCKDSTLLPEFIHSHDDPRFYYKLKEVSPGYLKIYCMGKILELIDNDKLKFVDEESNLQNQKFKIFFTPEGGFKISQYDLCMTLIENTIINMKACNENTDQIFMLIKDTNSAIIKPYTGLTYTYDTYNYAIN